MSVSRRGIRLLRPRPIRGAALAPAVFVPSIAHAAGSKLPQMDFSNPLTLTQVIWMVVIMAVLYVVLAFWGLPRIGAIIADRQRRIRGDLDAAREARREADEAIAALDRAMREARAAGERTVNAAIAAAKARAELAHAKAQAHMEERLARAEAEIAAARARAMATLIPIASEVTAALVMRVSGRAPAPDALDRALGAARHAG